MPPHASPTPITHGSPRLIAEQGTGQDAARAYTVRYRPAQHMPPHAHAAASISLVLAGGFEDTTTPSTTGTHQPSPPRACPPLTVAIKPAGAEHETLVNARGAISLVIQLPASAVSRFTSAASEHGPLARCRWFHANESTAALLSIWVDLLTHRIDLSTCLARLAPVFTAPDSPSPGSYWPEQSQHRPIAQAAALIAQGRSVGDTARAVNLNASHLTRTFKAHTGSTPTQWARRARLSAAAERVLTSRDSLSRCALAHGYTDQAHMTRRFRTHLGVTPGQLRTLRKAL